LKVERCAGSMSIFEWRGEFVADGRVAFVEKGVEKGAEERTDEIELCGRGVPPAAAETRAPADEKLFSSVWAKFSTLAVLRRSRLDRRAICSMHLVPFLVHLSQGRPPSLERMHLTCAFRQAWQALCDCVGGSGDKEQRESVRNKKLALMGAFLVWAGGWWISHMSSPYGKPNAELHVLLGQWPKCASEKWNQVSNGWWWVVQHRSRAEIIDLTPTFEYFPLVFFCTVVVACRLVIICGGVITSSVMEPEIYVGLSRKSSNVNTNSTSTRGRMSRWVVVNVND